MIDVVMRGESGSRSSPIRHAKVVKAERRLAIFLNPTKRKISEKGRQKGHNRQPIDEIDVLASGGGEKVSSINWTNSQCVL